MADRYLLESGSPDGYLLEDGTGVLLLNNSVAWEVDTSSLDFSISSDGLTVNTAGKITAGHVLARANTSNSSGYFEVLVTTAGAHMIIGLTSASQATTDFVGDSNGEGYDGADGNVYRAGSGVVTYATYTSGDRIGVCRKGNFLYFSKNGTWQGSADPSAGTGGIDVSAFASDVLYPAISTDGTALVATANFGATAFTYTIPTGVSSWDGSQSSVVTHATTGVLTGPGSTIAGTSAHIAIHGTTGALTGPGSTVAGTAAHIAIHTSTGALTGPGSTIVGTAARTREHATSGILTGPGSTIVGAAVYNAKHATSGVLTGAGSVVIGAAARTRAHATTGVLTGPGSTVAGAAVYNAKHTTSGTLTGPGSAVAGSAARFRAFATSGVLIGPGSTIVGSALRGTISTTHATSGALVGQPSIIDGTAARTRQHATSGVLVGPPAFIFGYATRWRDHASSGVLQGVTGVVFGRVFNGTPQLHDIPVDSDNLTDEPALPAANLGSISEPSGQIVTHPPYPPA